MFCSVDIGVKLGRGISVCGRRSLSSSSIARNPTSLHAWLNQLSSAPKSLTFRDGFHEEHLAGLYATLPTRDGTFGRPHQPPGAGTQLGYGHHLVFFHSRNPVSELREDGTDIDFCPPEPFARRMWAGGRMEWLRPESLHVGGKAQASSIIKRGSVTLKGFETDAKHGKESNPMVFVQQKLEVTVDSEAQGGPAIVEERTHVYLPTHTRERNKRKRMSSSPSLGT
jgi:hypothetical protein